MVTTLIISIADKKVRICFEGNFKNVAFNTETQHRVGNILANKLRERKLNWARRGVFRLYGVGKEFGLTGRLEPALGFEGDTLPVKLSYDTLAGEDMGLELPSFIIRLEEWRS